MSASPETLKSDDRQSFKRISHRKKKKGRIKSVQLLPKLLDHLVPGAQARSLLGMLGAQMLNSQGGCTCLLLGLHLHFQGGAFSSPVMNPQMPSCLIQDHSQDFPPTASQHTTLQFQTFFWVIMEK